MPNDTNVQAPTGPTQVITSDDIEPPTTITDPKLRKKIRQASSSGDGGESGEVSDAEKVESTDTASESGALPSGNFIFLGDYVDRGYFSLESLTLLLCLKAKYVFWEHSRLHLTNAR